MTRTVSTAGGGVAPGAGGDGRSARGRHAQEGPRRAPAEARQIARAIERGAAPRPRRRGPRAGSRRRAGSWGGGGVRRRRPGSASRARRREGACAKKRATARATASATVCWNSGLLSFFSSSAFEMNATSTRTAGIVAPTRTRNGACLMPRLRRAGDGVELDLDRLGELARLLQVRALGEVPEDEVEVGVGGRASAPGRSARRGAAFSRLATSCAILSEASSER